MVVRRRPGQVRDAIAAYLAHMQDASVAEIQEAVNAALGGGVPASSVRSYLRLNVGDLFERTARGRYRLVGQP